MLLPLPYHVRLLPPPAHQDPVQIGYPPVGGEPPDGTAYELGDEEVVADAERQHALPGQEGEDDVHHPPDALLQGVPSLYGAAGEVPEDGGGARLPVHVTGVAVEVQGGAVAPDLLPPLHGEVPPEALRDGDAGGDAAGDGTGGEGDIIALQEGAEAAGVLPPPVGEVGDADAVGVPEEVGRALRMPDEGDAGVPDVLPEVGGPAGGPRRGRLLRDPIHGRERPVLREDAVDAVPVNHVQASGGRLFHGGGYGEDGLKGGAVGWGGLPHPPPQTVLRIGDGLEDPVADGAHEDPHPAETARLEASHRVVLHVLLPQGPPVALRVVLVVHHGTEPLREGAHAVRVLAHGHPVAEGGEEGAEDVPLVGGEGDPVRVGGPVPVDVPGGERTEELPVHEDEEVVPVLQGEGDVAGGPGTSVQEVPHDRLLAPGGDGPRMYVGQEAEAAVGGHDAVEVGLGVPPHEVVELLHGAAAYVALHAQGGEGARLLAQVAEVLLADGPPAAVHLLGDGLQTAVYLRIPPPVLGQTGLHAAVFLLQLDVVHPGEVCLVHGDV